ncbi:MAG: YbaB/EbfC family nucleoid-associated protein, partial [Alphaproteobacteria bacterium HGW-Alphaproteobacteria-11]
GRMEAMQAELDAAEIEGRAGGGLVAVVMSGKGAVKKVSIDPSLMKEDEREILEDLIVAAAADAKHKAEALAAEKMKSVAGGLPIPPGFGL